MLNKETKLNLKYTLYRTFVRQRDTGEPLVTLVRTSWGTESQHCSNRRLLQRCRWYAWLPRSWFKQSLFTFMKIWTIKIIV